MLIMLQDSLFSAFSAFPNDKLFAQTTMENYAVAYNSSQNCFSFSSGLEYCSSIGSKTSSSNNTDDNSNKDMNEHMNGSTEVSYENLLLHCQRRRESFNLQSISRCSNNNEYSRQSKWLYFP